MAESLPPYQRHSKTSRDAAASKRKDKDTEKQRVFDLLASSRPLTDEQIQIRLNMPGNTERPRRIELQQEGYVREAGKGINRSGRSATTWTTTKRRFTAGRPKADVR